MDDLELIKQKINIVDLIQEYLPLKKSGVNFKANCPFHQEKSPSFVVSPERGIWHCFGCDKGGDHFKFLMEKDGLTFSEALEILAKRAGITLTRKKDGARDLKLRLYEANQKAMQFFNYILTEHSSGKSALEYLHKRGVTDETIKLFNLGYAPNSWESLSKFLRKHDFSIQELVDAGLAVASNRGCYDRFRGRVIFPLVNVKNEVAGFAGRILGIGEPKYLNTPVTPIFDKGNFLFGLNLAKGEIRQKNQIILVEGLMDMVMSYQSEVKNVVATQGTALTGDHIELIKKYTDTVLLCFDKDLAGDAASRRGIEMADAAGFNIKVVQIKDGKDTADMALKDPASWVKSVEEAENIYDYYLRSVSSRHKINTSEGKRRIGVELFPIWSKITDPLMSEHYLQKLSALLNMPEDMIRQEIKKSKNPTVPSFTTVTRQSEDSAANATIRNRRDLLEEYLITLLLKIPTDVNFVPNFPETIFLSENYRSIYVLLVLYLDAISFKTAAFSISDFSKTLSPELVPIVDGLYLSEIDDKLCNAKAWQEEINTVVTQLKKVLLKASLEKLSAEIKSAQAFGKIEILEALNRKFRDLSVKLKNL